MESAANTSLLIPNREQQAATRAAFFIAGFALSAWAPLIPFAKDRVGLDEAALGLLLLCFGAGSVAAMPLAGVLTARLGCRRIVASATILICIALPLLSHTDSSPVLAAALLLFGGGVGAIDVAMNIQAVIVERASGRSMMSGFHGMFSVGGIAGALGVSALLFLGTSPLITAIGVVGIIVTLLAGFARHLLPYLPALGDQRSGRLLVWPRGPVLIISLLCCILFLVEGAMLDWSAVFLTTRRDVAPAQAGFGYAAFAATMTLGRLSGDRYVQALGGRRVLRLGCIAAIAGLALAALVPAKYAAFAGFMLAGAGCANLVPVLYTAAGNQSVMPAGPAISAITTLGYAGILCGPALIGFVAQATNLNVAFAGLAGLLFIVVGCSRAAVR
jgi:predicted MFS family arabinose efflux permease